jgi:hypothetical protein
LARDRAAFFVHGPATPRAFFRQRTDLGLLALK